MRLLPGTTLLVLGVLGLLLATDCRRAVLHHGGPPAFYLEQERPQEIMLGQGFPQPGVHQINDGETVLAVIAMTGLSLSPSLADTGVDFGPPISGELYEIVLSGQEVSEIKRMWMAAGQRMALSIPLHPDRMTYEDWQVLPGVGPRLAEKITRDRQRNGDFVVLENLRRVSGVGAARIEAWRKFF